MDAKGTASPRAREAFSVGTITDPADMAASPRGDKIVAWIIQLLLIAIFLFQSAIIAATLAIVLRADEVGEIAICLALGPILPFGVLLVDALIVRQLVEGTASPLAIALRFVLPVSMAVFVAPILFTIFWAGDINREQANDTIRTRQGLVAAAGTTFDGDFKGLIDGREVIITRLEAIDGQFPKAEGAADHVPDLRARVAEIDDEVAAAEAEVNRLRSLAQCELRGLDDCPEGKTTGATGDGPVYQGFLVKIGNAEATRDLARARLDAARAALNEGLAAIETASSRRVTEMGALADLEKALQADLSKLQATIEDRSARRSEIVLEMAQASPSWTQPEDAGLAADLESLDAIATRNLSVWMTLWAGKVALIAFELSAMLAGHGFRHSHYGSRRREALALARDRETETTINVEIRVAERLARLDDVRAGIRTAAHFAKRTRRDFRRSERGARWPEWFARSA